MTRNKQQSMQTEIEEISSPASRGARDTDRRGRLKTKTEWPNLLLNGNRAARGGFGRRKEDVTMAALIR